MTNIAAQAEPLGANYEQNVKGTLQEVINLGDKHQALDARSYRSPECA